MTASAAPLVGVIMGSKSDYETLAPAVEILQHLGVPYEAKVVSAHRTPDDMFAYAEQAESRGLLAIIAAAGGAAHLPGMVAAKTLVPVLGVPVNITALNGLVEKNDALKGNLQALLVDLVKAKPATSKGTYLQKISLSSTMGPGVTVDQASLSLK